MLTDNLNASLILLVEDDDNHVELMKMALQDAEEEYRLAHAGTLREARSFIDRQAPDLVLADYRLPDGDGCELVPAVNGLCPVILLTSQGNEQIAVDAMKAGAQNYVVKSSAVFSAISRVVQRGMREWVLIQEQKRSEEERHRMERHLLHIQKLESLGTMSGGIAHDFNNLLQAVLGNLELSLMKLPPDAPVRNLLNKAFIAAERAAKLSGMMLAYSGKGVYSLKEQNLTELIENISTMLAAAVSKSIKFDMKLDHTLPQIMIDADQIQQVIMNLVINASEAIGTSNGLITLSTGAELFDQKTLDSSRLEEKLAVGRYVWLKVSDSGCGMDAETRDKLFEPFFTTKFTGRGLGLSAAQGIIRAHKGAVLVESSPGDGTTVQVLFPVADALQPGKTDSTAVEDDASVAPRHADTILVVDDEEIVREVCSEMLSELGFEVLSVSSGMEALRIFQCQGDSIDLVLLDYSMPGMDGVALFRELRKTWPHIPVLLASGFSQEEVAVRFTGLGLDGFIQKPFKLNRLGDEVKRVLKG
jgi:two-component system, cell cycle sensor histidine kinase and response regulator CckA